ncbi:YidC/Oxa1 family membrane protein insertase [Streptomyces sp. LP11]|uniref:Membrane protein insertase YidC n=1 Tax=Streptomyces pyxinicus TaxID=2970331 RepID=A0ABT2BCK2_9ACTN|nr:YidC/Oxa1 family membrane protein insertase [Streptomyces sp. LP11]MCS0606249.1 YidC/Oxa1 family membrane protein insertase [Streptomyces sp. LP11]
MSVFSVFAHLVEHLADLLTPLCHDSATAAAIVLFTALVRLLVHPLSRAAARGQRARAALRPRIAELRGRHAKDPERLRRAVLELHTAERVSPLSGILPGLLQLPAFFLLYHLFSTSAGSGLLAHRLFAAPLGGRWTDALADGGPFGPAGLVYLGLFALVAAVATFTYRRARRLAAAEPVVAGGLPGLGAVNRVAPFLSFLTLATVAAVPLAAALYIVTSTTWSALERAALYR